MIKNFNFIFKKKKIYKILFYLTVFFIFTFFSYFFTPHFFNYNSQLIEESFKTNNDINIKNISKISYKILPTPRLKVSGSVLNVKKNTLQIDGSEIEIILNLNSIFNYKKLYYNKIIINGGSIKIDTNNISQLLDYFKKSKLKIFLKKNNLILVKNDKFLFKINDSKTIIDFTNNQKQLSLKGIFLNHKITFLLDNKLGKGNNIIIKIPKLDIISNILHDC